MRETSATIKIVHVIPISRFVGKETLTYFTAKDLHPGTIISVPLRGKNVSALVVSSENALEAKTGVRKAEYTIKKIADERKRTIVSTPFVKASSLTARYFAGEVGAVLSALIPTVILKKYEGYEPTKPTVRKIKEDAPSNHEVLLFQADEKDRFASYKSFIRSEFANNHSIFFCLPTVADTERAAPLLNRGIEEYVYVFHGKLTQKETLARWKNALAEKHPILIVCTGSFLSLPRSDARTIIVENERSSAYKTLRRPFMDIRTFAEFFSRELDAKLILGDTFLRIETLYKSEVGKATPFAPLRFRTLGTGKQTIVDMREEALKHKRFEIVSDPLKKILSAARDEGEYVFALVSRRGLFPITICGDCGETIACEQCASPMVLHRNRKNSATQKDQNTFVCHRCGLEKFSSDICGACGSWRLATLGIGAERAEEEIKKLVPDAHVLRLDADITKGSAKKAQDIIRRFYSLPSAILVGTEMALPYLKRIANAAVISLDSLFAIPDFRMHERIFGMLLALREKATKRLLIQTRVRDSSFFNFVLQGNLSGFYKKELEDRKHFGYPPFTVLIKISWSGTEKAVLVGKKTLEGVLAEWKPNYMPARKTLRGSPSEAARKEKTTGHFGVGAIIRVDTASWPDHNLVHVLASLPPAFEVEVAPEDIL